MKGLLRRAALVLAILLAIVMVAFVVVVSIGIRVDLDPLRVPFQAIASKALGRAVTLDGPMTLIPTWSPTVEIEGLRVGNPAGWPSSEFARMDLARITVGVLPVFLGRAVIRELTAEGVSVRLEQTEDGRVNWLLGLDESAADEPTDEPRTEGPPLDIRNLFIRSAAIENLVLNDVHAAYHDAVAGSQGEFELSSLRGALGTHDPLSVVLSGELGREGYELTIEGGPPADLMKSDIPWPLELVLEVADTTYRIKTVIEDTLTIGGTDGQQVAVAPRPIGDRFGKLEVGLSGERLESLEQLLGVDLPPWGPWEISAIVEGFGGGRYEGEIEVTVGTSALRGTLEATLGEPPRVDVTLTAPTVQLDDFDTKGWSLTEERPLEQETPNAPELTAPSEARDEKAPILSPQVLRSVNGSLSVSVDRVASGGDPLGKGNFTLALEAGRLSLEPFELEVPGGKARLHLVFHPTEDSVAAEFTVAVDRFDYGLLARRMDPNAEMRGLIRLDVAINANAPTARELMGYANGRVDFAVFPESLDAGLVDLWAVNLVTAATSAVDSAEQSHLNCLVGLFDVENGVMRERSLMLDTSNMSVGGTVNVDFANRHLKIHLVPKAKKPEFFSAATPVRIDGDFEDFGFGVKVTDVLRSVASMTTSVIHVPIRRIFFTEEEQDDLEECLEALKRTD